MGNVRNSRDRIMQLERTVAIQEGQLQELRNMALSMLKHMHDKGIEFVGGIDGDTNDGY